MSLSDDLAALQAIPFVADNADPNAIALINQAEALIQTQLTPPARLITGADLAYAYSFKIPVQYGGGGIGFNPANNSLFIGGTVANGAQNKPLVAEVSIPTTPGTMAPILQPFADVSESAAGVQLDAVVNAQGICLGGLCVDNGSLLWSVYGSYDASGSIKVVMGKSTLNLAAPNAQGMFSLAAKVDGVSLHDDVMGAYIEPIPPELQSAFNGNTHLCGRAGGNIIGYSSCGPSAFGFVDSALGATPALATPYLYYPAAKPMQGWNWKGNPFSYGMAMINNSKVYGMLFGGTFPVGNVWYGFPKETPPPADQSLNPPDPTWVDPCSIYKGDHSQGRMPTVWIYDHNDVLAATEPYLLTPTATALGGSGSPCVNYQSPCATIDGVAHDRANALLYFLQNVANQTWVHVYSYPH